MIKRVNRRVTKVLRRIKQIVLFNESQVVYNGKTFKAYWDETYGGAHLSFFASKKIMWQTRRAFVDGGFRPDEFSLYGLERLSKSQQSLFLSQKKKDHFLISFYGSNWTSILGVLKDKYIFYSYLKKQFNRDVICIRSMQDRLPFLSFCNQHDRIFAKLIKGSCGRGCNYYTITDSEQASEIFNELIGYGEWIIEELIEQNPAISQFNESSVNTIRFPSFKKNGVVKCVFPCMRFGRAGSIVDNAGQGGMFVSINQETGEIITDAIDEKGHVFVSHPDSKVTFRGFRIPQWDSIVEIIKDAHLALPDDQVYVAFDLALSDKGWCIVEGNWGDWILQQASLQRGLKNEFVSLLNGSR